MTDVQRILERGRREGVFPAAVAAVAVDGEIVAEHAVGHTRTWDAPGVAAAAARPVDAATRFDLASLTKVVTAATLLGLLDERGADAAVPVVGILPEFDTPAMRRITVAHLLSHTAGFAAEWPDRAPDPGAARFRGGARPLDAAGSGHRYSCVGYIWAGLAAEALGGASLDVLAARYVLGPLGMTETGFAPGPHLRPQVAATEFQSDPPRGMVHGEVHDETAWALGGVAGNAGLFGTARDVIRLAEALRLPPGRSALRASVVRAMTSPVAVSADGYAQALGPRIGEAWALGLGRGTVSHTGFTGTSVAAQPGGRRSVVFLTNRVHPLRTPADAITTIRRRLTDAAAAAAEGAHS